MQRKRLADYKPNSVLRFSRSEAAIIHLGFEFPRSSSGLPGNRTGRPTAPEGAVFPYLALLHVGFTKPARYRAAGALLPHLFTLTSCLAVCFLWHFPSLTGPRITRHIALWSSDFPLPLRKRSPVCQPNLERIPSYDRMRSSKFCNSAGRAEWNSNTAPVLGCANRRCAA